jgi:LCP family protein required for cell wall assembly
VSYPDRSGDDPGALPQDEAAADASGQEADGPTGADPDSGAGSAGHRRNGRWWRLLLLVSGLVLLLVAGGIAVGGWFYARSVDNAVARVDVFGSVPEAGRPAKEAPAALNLLVLGSDSRDPAATGSRTDTIMLVHLPADRQRAQLISIPRDTWTTLPTDAGNPAGGTNAKINAAYAWGGTPLMVRSVERFTGVRIDHVVMVDFAGFKDIVDAVGGVTIEVPETFTSIHPPFRTFHAGVQRMDGATALDFARQRKQFRDGDFSRMKNQQQLIGALVDRATERGLLTNPGRLDDFLKATAGAVTVDTTLSLFDLGWELREIGRADIDRLTSPSAGMATMGNESVVMPDERAARELFAAVRTDTVDEWLAANPQD